MMKIERWTEGIDDCELGYLIGRLRFGREDLLACGSRAGALALGVPGVLLDDFEAHTGGDYGRLEDWFWGKSE
jgi:hypothetical protein